MVRCKAIWSQQDAELAVRLKALDEPYQGYGWLMLHSLLRSDGPGVSRKRTESPVHRHGHAAEAWMSQEAGMPGAPMAAPMRLNESLSLNFGHDQLADGRRIPVLNIVADYSRICAGQIVDVSISVVHMARYLVQLRQTRGFAWTLVPGDGREMISKAMFHLTQQENVYLHFIHRGQPIQDMFLESFNGRFRVGCSNQHWLRDLAGTGQIVDDGRDHDNAVRQRSLLGNTHAAVYEVQVAGYDESLAV